MMDQDHSKMIEDAEEHTIRLGSVPAPMFKELKEEYNLSGKLPLDRESEHNL